MHYSMQKYIFGQKVLTNSQRRRILVSRCMFVWSKNLISSFTNDLYLSSLWPLQNHICFHFANTTGQHGQILIEGRSGQGPLEKT